MISETIKNSNIKNSFIYFILWAAGCLVAGYVLFLWNRSEKFERITIFNNLAELKNNRGSSNNIVDELLLSANEMNIYGKSALIEFNNKDNKLNEDYFMQQIKTNPDKAYQSILKNKLQKLRNPKSSVSDFNVKPVPK